MARRQTRNEQLRQVIAQESARIMAEHGIGDYLVAKKKAAENLGVTERSALPRNCEIEDALSRHLQLFTSDTHESHLSKLRSAALMTMEKFAEFNPRLVGPVLAGTATAHTDIDLHLFADPPELVAMRLFDLDVRYEVGQRSIRYGGRSEICPSYRFDDMGLQFDLTIFPGLGLREAPSSPVDGKPMKRSGINQLRQQLTAAGDL